MEGSSAQAAFSTVDATCVIDSGDGMDVYVTAGMIEQQVRRLARALSGEFADRPAPLFCPILNGGAFFYHDLARALADQEHLGLHEVAYVYASRYGASKEGSETVRMNWLAIESTNLRDRSVVVVDDILEEGRTAGTVVDGLRDRGAGRVLTAFACRKVPARTRFAADFVLFDIPGDIWAVGYGMDLESRWRNFPSILAAPR